MNYKIKITGSGTSKDIVKALKEIIEGIEEAQNSDHETAILDGAEWEDTTLMTEISAD